MEDSSNQKKKQAIEDGEEDRISSLPDPILHEILSSMDLKYAIQTCALSKRWRYLWTSLPNLHFDFDPYPPPNDSRRLQFTHFVNQVLSQRDTNSNLCNFYFSPYFCDHPSFIENSLSYAISHNVQQLHVAAFCYPNAYQLPLCLINSESLKSLTFEYGSQVPLDKSLALPGLKTLHITGFLNGSAHFITETVGNCPNLETLILDCLQLNDFNITAPKLKKLELWYDDEGWLSDYYQLDSDGLDPVPDEQKIVVSAPRLTSFKLEGRVSPVFSATSLPCLDNVDIDIRVPFNAIIERSLSLNVINMLGQLREASSVTLSLITLEVLAMHTDALKSHPSPFHKLKHLNLIAEELIQRVRSPNLTLPLNVITYLTRGSSCSDILVVKFLGNNQSLSLFMHVPFKMHIPYN
ncbi:hypothetical protein ACSBR1_030517 [Camellia fascicularis]